MDKKLTFVLAVVLCSSLDQVVGEEPEVVIVWWHKQIRMEAKLVPKYEPFVVEYLDTKSIEFLAVQEDVESECGLVNLGEQYSTNCTLESLSEGSVFAQFTVNISTSTDRVGLKYLSPYHVKFQLQEQVESFRFVYLESDFDTPNQDRKWQLALAMIAVAMFIAALLCGLFYVPLNQVMEKRIAQKKQIKPKINRKLAMQMELVKERRNEDARLDAEDEAQEAAIRKAFLVEEYKRRKELEAMRVNTLPEEIKRI
ncbi:uncharacterized protein LOC142342434 [Convolutriloba macropyga]|uniref:uncharacterized protein LOC142342434 n=1 Tax=Convolutriloba macropyga TaxID=536237 RepID=UPI003F525A60